MCLEERNGMGRSLYVRVLFQSYVLQLPHQAPHCIALWPLGLGEFLAVAAAAYAETVTI